MTVPPVSHFSCSPSKPFVTSFLRLAFGQVLFIQFSPLCLSDHTRCLSPSVFILMDVFLGKSAAILICFIVYLYLLKANKFLNVFLCSKPTLPEACLHFSKQILSSYGLPLSVLHPTTAYPQHYFYHLRQFLALKIKPVG